MRNTLRWATEGLAALTLVLALPTVALAAPAELARYDFDEGSGQVAVDSAPLMLDGRLGRSDDADGGDPDRIAGLRGGALHFGGGSFVRLPDAPELAPPTVTVEAVVRASGSPGSFRYLVSHGASGCYTGSYGMYTGPAGGIAFYVYDGAGYTVTATAGPDDVWDGAWHHIAGSFDGAEVRLYVDGRLVGAPQPAAHHIAYGMASDAAYIGSYEGSCSLPFRGDLDSVAVWSGALAPDTVAAAAAQALTSAPAGRPGAPLVARLPGTLIPAPGPSSRPVTPPGAPLRACQVRPARAAIPVRRRTVVNVQVSLRGRPVRGAVVVARQASARLALGRARTSARGRAKVSMRPSRAGRVAFTVTGRPGCAGALSVTRKGR